MYINFTVSVSTLSFVMMMVLTFEGVWGAEAPLVPDDAGGSSGTLASAPLTSKEIEVPPAPLTAGEIPLTATGTAIPADSQDGGKETPSGGGSTINLAAASALPEVEDKAKTGAPEAVGSSDSIAAPASLAASTGLVASSSSTDAGTPVAERTLTPSLSPQVEIAPKVVEKALLGKDDTGGVNVTFTKSDLPELGTHVETYTATSGKQPLDSPPQASHHMLYISSRGVLSAWAAAFGAGLEGIFNLPCNAEAPPRSKLSGRSNGKIYLRDVFPVMGGAAEGAIVAAAWSSKRANPAPEVLRMLTHHMSTIFEERENPGDLDAPYPSEGRDDVLVTLFGHDTFAQGVAPGSTLYVGGFIPSSLSTIFYTNALHIDCLGENSIRAGLKVATAGLFPLQEILEGDKRVYARDAGSKIFSVFQNVSTQSGGKYHILSIGTGRELSQSSFLMNGQSADSTPIDTFFLAQEVADNQNCKDAVASPSSPLMSFTCLQPQRNLMGKWGDANKVPDLVRNALKTLESDIVAQEIRALGFVMPDLRLLRKLQEDIYDAAFYALPVPTFNDLGSLEKAWFKRVLLGMIGQLDFSPYDKWTHNGKPLTPPQKLTLVTDATTEMFSDREREKQKEKQQKGLMQSLGSALSWGKTIDGLAVDTETILRGAEFHRYVSEYSSLKKDDLQSGNLTNLASLYAEFRDVCDHENALYKYVDVKSPYLKELAVLYWKHKLKEVFSFEINPVSLDILKQLHANFTTLASSQVLSKTYIWFGIDYKLHNSRVLILADGLKTVVEKHIADRVKLATSM